MKTASKSGPCRQKSTCTEEYLSIVRERPHVTRNAIQRVYDMVISYGTEEYIDNKKKLVRHNVFRDEADGDPTPYSVSRSRSCGS